MVFHKANFYSTTPTDLLDPRAFLHVNALDSYVREFVSLATILTMGIL